MIKCNTGWIVCRQFLPTTNTDNRPTANCPVNFQYFAVIVLENIIINASQLANVSSGDYCAPCYSALIYKMVAGAITKSAEFVSCMAAYYFTLYVQNCYTRSCKIALYVDFACQYWSNVLMREISPLNWRSKLPNVWVEKVSITFNLKANQEVKIKWSKSFAIISNL